MRRPVAFAAAFAAAAVLTYLTGPNILDYIDDSKTEKVKSNTTEIGAEADRVPSADVAKASPPIRPSLARRAPELATKSQTPRDPKPVQVPLRRKPKVHDSVATASSVTGLEPARKADMRPSAAVASADPTRGLTPAQNLANPMADRWIDELSGQRAKLSIGVSPRSERCPAAAASAVGCERPEAPKDISLAGVVVKSQNLTRPGSPLDGDVARGHFIDKTPAVFIE